MSAGLADSVVTRVVMQRDLMQAMDEHCRSISARVTSRDKSVSVEVDGLGSMTGLWLGETSRRHDPDSLAKLIIETADAAARVAQQRQTYLIEEFAARLAKLQQRPLPRRDGSVFVPAASG